VLGCDGDDWAIFTSDRDIKTAETNMQTAINGVARQVDQTKRIKNLAGKNSMHAYMQEKDSQSSRPGDSIERMPSGN
jgi:hypothetical protein